MLTLDRKRHLASLDGLRWIAALIVVAGHLEIYVFGKGNWLSAHGLCVDFFFILSGFVIARSYEAKFLAGMSLPHYARGRLTRLYPLIGIGIILGYVTVLTTGAPDADINVRLASQLMFVPTFWLANSFLLNAVQWSLVVELIVNFAHFSIARWLTLRVAVALAVGFGCALGYLASAHGNLRFGWDAETFFVGLVKGAFGFTAGIVLYRAGDRLPFRVHWLAVAAALPVIVPLASITVIEQHWFAEPVIVIFALPALCLAGIHCQVPLLATSAARWLGGMSYPVYAIHLPLLFAGKAAADRLGVSGIAFCLAWTPAMLTVSWLAMRFLDAPVQRWFALPKSKGLVMQPC